MNVLSLFDGMSCGQLAFQKLGIEFDGVKNKYFASEIKKHAIKVTQHNFPNTIQIGNVLDVKGSNLPQIDVLIGGSPCQDLSIANVERKGLSGSKSSLFWEYYRLLKEINPKYFLLENVDMPEEDTLTITNSLGVYPININSSLVSAQTRNRWYWTNIEGDGINLFGEKILSQPPYKKVELKDIIINGYVDKEKARCLNTKAGANLGSIEVAWNRYTTTGMLNLVFLSEDLDYQKGIRGFEKVEMERLQTVPEGYTDILTRVQAGNLLGDGWTIDVIVHILKGLTVDLL